MDSAIPKGPRGEKRPADVSGAAVMIAKIRHRRYWPVLLSVAGQPWTRSLAAGGHHQTNRAMPEPIRIRETSVQRA
jgi:hypothetical protein